jgi:hypothetical protein
VTTRAPLCPNHEAQVTPSLTAISLNLLKNFGAWELQGQW